MIIVVIIVIVIVIIISLCICSGNLHAAENMQRRTVRVHD